MIELNPYGNPIRIRQIRLYTPGFRGNVTERSVSSYGDRSQIDAGNTDRDILKTLAQSGISPQLEIEISNLEKVSDDAYSRDSTVGEGIRLEIPTPRKDYGQFILTTDANSNIMAWSLPLSLEPHGDREPEYNIYNIHEYMLHPTDPYEPTGQRSYLDNNKLIKILTFPRQSPLFGNVGADFAAWWERKHRSYAIRSITPENYNQLVDHSIDTQDWKKLENEKVLLLVHGTFSNTHHAFSDLAIDMVRELYQRYNGRVIALDHYTLSEDPEKNVEWFIKQIPENIRMNIDILCHSRGGLVSRVLCENQGEISLGSKIVGINKVVFVATPNAGTILADDRYIDNFLNIYTNLASLFPTSATVSILEGVLTVLKILAVDAVKNLPGLKVMSPKSNFFSYCNELKSIKQSNACYYALSSDYEPKNSKLGPLAHYFTNKIFCGANDLVVPALSVYGENGNNNFPILEGCLYPKNKGINHSRYFYDSESQKQILNWLTG